MPPKRTIDDSTEQPLQPSTYQQVINLADETSSPQEQLQTPATKKTRKPRKGKERATDASSSSKKTVFDLNMDELLVGAAFDRQVWRAKWGQMSTAWDDLAVELRKKGPEWAQVTGTSVQRRLVRIVWYSTICTFLHVY